MLEEMRNLKARERLLDLVRQLDRLKTEREELGKRIARVEEEIDNWMPSREMEVNTAHKAPRGSLPDRIIHVLETAGRPLSLPEIFGRVGPVKTQTFRTTIYRLKSYRKIKSTGTRGMYVPGEPFVP